MLLFFFNGSWLSKKKIFDLLTCAREDVPLTQFFPNLFGGFTKAGDSLPFTLTRKSWGDNVAQMGTSNKISTKVILK